MSNGGSEHEGLKQDLTSAPRLSLQTIVAECRRRNERLRERDRRLAEFIARKRLPALKDGDR